MADTKALYNLLSSTSEKFSLFARDVMELDKKISLEKSKENINKLNSPNLSQSVRLLGDKTECRPILEEIKADIEHLNDISSVQTFLLNNQINENALPKRNMMELVEKSVKMVKKDI